MKISTFIEELRDTDSFIQHVYSQGGCYKFHVLLSKMYKNCTPYISQDKNHIITRYKNKYYDIYGEVYDLNGYTLLTMEERLMVERWSPHRNNLLRLTECPMCNEPITYNEKNHLENRKV
jgi:hypothetical protein